MGFEGTEEVVVAKAWHDGEQPHFTAAAGIEGTEVLITQARHDVG